MREAQTPGIAVSLVRGDEIAWTISAGWADRENDIRVTPDTVFMLASVSKTVTCAGVMSVVEDGDLDLDADVNDYLPFEVRIPAGPREPITTRMLLIHTSAIRDRFSVWGTPYSRDSLYFHGDSPIELGEFLRSYLVPGESRYREGANFYERRPGGAYAYSNIAVALAAYIAEVVAHRDFNGLCKQRIMKPLGMDQSGFRLSDITTTNLAMPSRVVRRRSARLLPDGSHRRRLRREHQDVLPPRHARGRRHAHELLPRRPAMGHVPGDRPQAPRGARVAFRSRAPSSSGVD